MQGRKRGRTDCKEEQEVWQVAGAAGGIAGGRGKKKVGQVFGGARGRSKNKKQEQE